MQPYDCDTSESVLKNVVGFQKFAIMCTGGELSHSLRDKRKMVRKCRCGKPGNSGNKFLDESGTDFQAADRDTGGGYSGGSVSICLSV